MAEKWRFIFLQAYAGAHRRVPREAHRCLQRVLPEPIRGATATLDSDPATGDLVVRVEADRPSTVYRAVARVERALEDCTDRGVLGSE